MACAHALQVDTGLQILPGTDGETATQGLDGLGDRCKAFYKQVCGVVAVLTLAGLKNSESPYIAPGVI